MPSRSLRELHCVMRGVLVTFLLNAAMSDLLISYLIHQYFVCRHHFPISEVEDWRILVEVARAAHLILNLKLRHRLNPQLLFFFATEDGVDDLLPEGVVFPILFCFLEGHFGAEV